MEKLTERQEQFCLCYLEAKNAREAALRAGYPPAEAEGEGLRLLRDPRVLRRLKKLEKSRLDSEKTLAKAGLRRLAFAPVGDCLRLLLFHSELEEQQVQKLDLFMLSEVKKTRDGGMQMKFFDRMKALEKLLKLEDSADSMDQLAALYQAIEGTNTALKESGND